MKGKILVADTLGFCFGVRRALEMVEKEIAEKAGPDSPVATFGPLIHNPTVLEDLERQGVRVVNSAEEVGPSERVLIRAHGVPLPVLQQLKEKGVKLFDGTCPRVQKSERIVREYCDKGWQVVLTGDHSHGEVEAVSSYCEDLVVFDTLEAARRYIPQKNTLLISQTTFSAALFEEIVQLLAAKCREKGVSFKRFNTVCPATEARQKALVQLCGKVDALVVIGGKKSANTCRLYDTAREHLEAVWHIEDAGGVVPQMGAFETIGISAGASTPDYVIEEVKRALEQLP
jgi:4-hydroxy-3-methylbut-2-en-1-yl diphosphate reductase